MLEDPLVEALDHHRRVLLEDRPDLRERLRVTLVETDVPLGLLEEVFFHACSEVTTPL
jgi:hypothetical protein